MTMADSPDLDFARSPLDTVAVRVLGALVEKAFTTPDNYPLSLNAMAAACNQASNRDPVMALDEGEVSRGLRELIRRSLAREVHRSDARVKRYRHALEDTLHLHEAEMAALCVLMLRGPQTTGEIKGRTTRMFEFDDLARVDVTLQSLMTLPIPLAVQLPRQPGQKEARYAHALSGELRVEASAPVVSSEEEPGRLEALEQEVAALRAELSELRGRFDAFQQEFR